MLSNIVSELDEHASCNITLLFILHTLASQFPAMVQSERQFPQNRTHTPVKQKADVKFLFCSPPPNLRVAQTSMRDEHYGAF